MRNLTEILLICDISGSRNSMREEARTGINKFIKDQQGIPGAANLSLVFFNAGPEYLRKAMWRQPLEQAKEIQQSEYNPTGGTALNDAIGESVDDLGVALDKLPEDQKPNRVLVAIETDGLENSSHLFTTQQIKDKLEHQQKTYNWIVLYLAQHLGASEVAHSHGISGQNVRSFDTGNIGTGQKYMAASNVAYACRMADTTNTSMDMADIVAGALAAAPETSKRELDEIIRKKGKKEEAHK
jgi:hypothetical protein